MVILLCFPPNPNCSSLLCNPAFLAGLLIVNVYHLEGFLSSWILYCQVSSDNLFYFSLLPNLFTHHTGEIKQLIRFSEYTKEKNKQSAYFLPFFALGRGEPFLFVVPTVLFITHFCVIKNFYLFHLPQLNSPKATHNSPVSFGPSFGDWDREFLSR